MTRRPTSSPTPRLGRGLSFFGWFLVLLAIGAAASLGIRLVPHYVDHSTIKSVVSDYAGTREAARASNKALREDITRRLKMNNVRGFDLREAMTVERDRDSGTNTIVFNYEVREEVVGNLDVVLSFQAEIPITGRP